ncbi:MAG: SDR family oxidoreductase, partial [bacterium]
GCFPYNVAKAGVNAFVQSLAIEWGPEIRAVSIAPGFIDTPGNDTYFETFRDPAKARSDTESMHPTGRIGTPDEIGSLCAFLASSHAAFINGVTITVDGGRSALMQDGAKEYN